MEDMKSRQKEQREKISRRMGDIKHKIIVMSGKGGVGKSTVAANLATELSRRGHNVGLIDCDMHGPSIPQILGIDEGVGPSQNDSSIDPIATEFGPKIISLSPFLPEKDSPVIWRGPLKMKTIQQFLGDVNWGSLDYLIFDLPPGTGDEPLTIVQLISNPDGAVIVTTPQEVALQTIRRAVKFSKEVKLPVLGLIENMSGFVCPHCGTQVNIFKSGGGESLAEELDIPFLGSIPLDPDVVESGETGRPFVMKNNSKSTEFFRRAVDKLVNSLNDSSRGDNK